MSLILDALNRAEQDRKNKNSVPTLDTLHQPANYPAPANRSLKMLLLAAVTLLLIVVGVGVWWFRSAAHSTGTSNAAITPTPVKSASETALVPVVENTATKVQPAVSPQASSPVVEAQPHKTQESPQALNQLYSSADISADAKNPEIDQLYTAEETAPESETIVDPLTVVPAQQDAIEPRSITLISNAVADPENAKARTFDSLTDVMAFNDLPWNAKQQIPTISYSRHNYAANNISSVVINGQTSGQGNLISGDFVVEEILKDGVVLRYKDKVFKLRKLNGWVNM
jgi:general secretion pathway protein B